jgi:hypothetical protein
MFMILNKKKLKVYRLRGKAGNPDFSVTINDLIPIEHKSYDFDTLVKYLNYTAYEPDWENPMDEEYDLLYKMHGNPKIDFFIIKKTNMIVIPGTYLYPTKLKIEDIPLLYRKG